MNKKSICALACGAVVAFLVGCSSVILINKFKEADSGQPVQPIPQIQQQEGTGPMPENNNSTRTEEEYEKILESCSFTLKKDGKDLRKYPVFDIALYLYPDPWWEITEDNNDSFVVKLYQDQNNFFTFGVDLTIMKLKVLEVGEEGYVYRDTDAQNRFMDYLIKMYNSEGGNINNIPTQSY